MPNLLIRNVDEATLARLKKHAAANKRSLQAELQAIVERAAEVHTAEESRKLAEKIRRKLSGRKHSDSAALIREDRER
jgi:plasmid stability protein